MTVRMITIDHVLGNVLSIILKKKIGHFLETLDRAMYMFKKVKDQHNTRFLSNFLTSSRRVPYG